ncbi:MAG: ribonuclease P protein component [Chlorobiaceae bacterium]|nr:ribonuclease P protein component [Chlorobiaceae bacterium]
MLTGKRINALPRHEIARGNANLSRLFATGNRRKGGALMMITSSVAPQEAGRGASVRVLFTVGKKHVPVAVERNRIKRLMREAYRLEKRLLPASSATEVVFVAFMYRGRRDAIPSLQDFRVEVGRLLKAFVKERMTMSMNKAPGAEYPTDAL